MAPDATPEEVRQAYLRLALELHPDRLGQATDEERALAEARMAEVNVAWSVLGDEGRRLRYDQEVRAAGGPSSVEEPFVHLVRRSAPVHDVEEGEDPDRPRPSLRRSLTPVVVVLALLVGVVVVTAYAAPDEPTGQQPVQTQDDLPVGTCVTLPPTGDVLAVPCGTPSDGTVALVLDWPGTCPVALEPLARPERSQLLCLRD